MQQKLDQQEKQSTKKVKKFEQLLRQVARVCVHVCVMWNYHLELDYSHIQVFWREIEIGN